MRSEALYLWDIIDAIDSIDGFLVGKNHAQFDQDEMLRSAVYAKLIIIGEAVSQLSEPLKSKYPSIPWRDIQGLRNAVIHGYFKVDWDVIWSTATTDAHDLQKVATEMLAREFPEFRPENG